MMASTPGSSFSDRSGALHTDTNDRKTTRAILPPSPSTVRFTDNSDIDGDSDSDLDGATEAYNIIWDSFCGLPTRDAYPSFFLPDQQAYDRLCEKISEHDGLLSYFNESLRKDWNAETGILTLRLMPSPMHEHFQDCLIDAIKKELNRIATEYPSLRSFRNSIKSCAHTDFGGSTHLVKSPDGQFSYVGISQPQLVIEVAYSEAERAAMLKSKEYFIHSPGKVNAVLLVDIDYALKPKRREENHSHCGSLFLWTARKHEGVLTVQRTINSAVFRDNGHATMGELVLPFELFIPRDQQDKLPVRDVALHLSYEMLAEFVTDAEQRQLLADATPAPPSPTEKIMFLDEHGVVMSEETPPQGVKRRRGMSQSELFTRSTRSMSRPRRSPRLRSASQNR